MRMKMGKALSTPEDVVPSPCCIRKRIQPGVMPSTVKHKSKDSIQRQNAISSLRIRYLKRRFENPTTLEMRRIGRKRQAYDQCIWKFIQGLQRVQCMTIHRYARFLYSRLHIVSLFPVPANHANVDVPLILWQKPHTV